MKQSLFDAIGGLPTLQKVHKIFYDKAYEHDWLKHFFVGHNQQAIENRQTGFMAIKMGGKVTYMGKEPKAAHEHMFITQELLDVRTALLREALEEANVAEDLIKRWLKIDNAFGQQITKDSTESFYKITWPYKKHIVIPKPAPPDNTTEK